MKEVSGIQATSNSLKAGWFMLTMANVFGRKYLIKEDIGITTVKVFLGTHYLVDFRKAGN